MPVVDMQNIYNVVQDRPQVVANKTERRSQGQVHSIWEY